MASIFIFVTAGIVVGYFDIIPQKWLDKVKSLPMICLLFILFFMGSKIGLEPKVIENINVIGIRALIIALGGIGGSLLSLKIVAGKIRTIKERQEA